jgi:hypothetical protein
MNRASPDSFTRPTFGEPVGRSEKIQNRYKKMSLFRRQAMSGPKGENARWDNDLPAPAGSPKITNPELFSVAV